MDDIHSNQDIPTPQKNTKMSLSLDYRLIIVLLLLVIGGMLWAWKPWQNISPLDTNRVISVTGDANLKAEPDEFVFSPDYQFKDKDKAAALTQLTKKSDEVTKKLKELGVADSKIKTNSDGYNNGYYFEESSGLNTYSLRLTVTVSDKALAQKVQDYLVSTSPTGSVSPNANFSDAKRKQLASKARDEATKDARIKADQSAANLGFTIGKIKSVKDGSGFDTPIPLYSKNSIAADSAAANSPSLGVQAGENDLNYSVNVVYYVK